MIRLRLIWKLVLINALSLSVVLLLVAVSIHWLAATYFMTLMQTYNVPIVDIQGMFLQAVDRYLLLASLIGFAFALGMSLWLNYRLVFPITQIVESANRISKGDFSMQVEIHGCGEIDELCIAFNRMAGELKAAEQLRKDFVVDVAHELRTPLTNIRGYMEGLRDEIFKPDSGVIGLILEETMRLAHLVEDLLQLARADVAKSRLKVVSLDLSGLIQQTIDRFSHRFALKSLQVSDNTAEPATVVADPDRITQVLTNLFENALRYAPAGGLIEITTSRDGHRVRLSISNDCEEPLSNTSQLFERFQRGDTSRSRQYGGAGLGLAIVRELIVAHCGEVGNQFADKKATFWFELPRGQ
jgi:two-component system, OmpR family, sensor histidine kinase BaeS